MKYELNFFFLFQKLSKAQVATITESFNLFDRSRSGELGLAQMREIARHIDREEMTDEELMRIIRRLDKDRSGTITLPGSLAILEYTRTFIFKFKTPNIHKT
jgi:Ca2+-binding EF-hand superfamily protein